MGRILTVVGGMLLADFLPLPLLVAARDMIDRKVVSRRPPLR
jgi:hypothetical protein